jgi:MFS family permease
MNAPTETLPAETDSRPWYAGVTRYQWLVLVIACAGWVFDQYESQIFNITSSDLLRDVLQSPSQDVLRQYKDNLFAVFLLGGTLGGLVCGMLADRYGRRPVMVLTIVLYSLFSGLTYFAQTGWDLAGLRFLVAMGVGGEWAVAAALVSEVFPKRARAHASAIFHASSVLGIWMAAFVGILVGTHWRIAYLIGILPALLILWVRASVREPERWVHSRASESAAASGSLLDLLRNPRYRVLAIMGMLLATVGLGTFWGVCVAGQDLVKEVLVHQDQVPSKLAEQKAKFAYGIVQTAGSGLGLLAFGPICARWGRRPTFIAFQIASLVIVPIICFCPQNYLQLLLLLPIFGFLTLGIHAGFAIYFPELFPTHLRATGASFCFNGGRLLSAGVLGFSGWLKTQIDLRWAMTSLSGLFLLGIVLVLFMPETRHRELPE